MRSRWFWIVLLLTLFVLAFDVWHWADPISLGWLGMPSWLHWFILLQCALILALAFFARFGWHENDRNDG